MRLPRFVEREFREFLTCGCLAAGFARFHCDGCAHDRLVPFSCKGRGFCPSCGGRRMAERSAHLVDHVLPDVPMRQWVLSLPHRLRYLLAWDHELCRAVAGVYVRAVLGFLRTRARRAGVADGRSGAVVMIQRFGGALNLNVHLHALVIDGVFERAGERFAFHPSGRLTRDDAAAVVAVAVRRIERLLARRGVMATAEERGAPDGWTEHAPVLAGLAAASVEGRTALGPRRGARVARYGRAPEESAPVTLGPCHAARGGYDLHAGVVVRAGERERLERLCRYTLRPPLALTRGGRRVGRLGLVRRAGWNGCRGGGGFRQAARRRLSVGGVDAADVRDRRAGVPAVRRATAADGAHRACADLRPHPAASGTADRPSRAAAAPNAAAAW